ncbi:hypothetical protein DM860_001174 [Cuscuta australis]|uniref:F-box/LRR-repeat protein 15-like leucin rich repeat domain-containing protein n=1 Tax=Cuscuta australis TaxID=267555 RepID=A0A328DT82_9ASTE|nr:hypothetical protein DM860_001174 [Cuscuta australis]
MACGDSSESTNGAAICHTGGINDRLGDDELRAVLARLGSDKDKDNFGLVCKRWLRLQSAERKRLCARAGPLMLRRLAARFTCLFELDLSQSVSRSFYPGVTDDDLSVIATSFTCLKLLHLRNCKGITDVGMKSIASSLSSLKFLDVSHCRKLTDNGLSAVARGCQELRTLHLIGCKFVSDSLLRALSENCFNLEELSLQGCTNITDSGITVLVEGCRRMKHLDINKCSNIGDTGVLHVSRACFATLKTLKLLDCFKVGDESISNLAKCCRNLETLIIGGCRNITDESMISLAAACNNSLRILRMDWCLSVSDISLDIILFSCRKLEVLDIGCCEEVTDSAFRQLGSEGCKLALRVFKVSNCPKITVAGIDRLLKSCDSLEYLDVRSCPHITKTRCEEAGLGFPKSCNVNFNGNIAEHEV